MELRLPNSSKIQKELNLNKIVNVMTRIEIPLDEYKSLNSKIKELETKNSNLSKELEKGKELLEKLKALILDLKEEGFLNRLFTWKKVIKPLEKACNE